MRRTILLGLVALVVSGCSITQTVDPAVDLATGEICIIKNPPVREGFLTELKSALQAKNAQVRVLSPDATVTSCGIVMTYLARWKWDLAMYMSYVEIRVFQSGQVVGRALYDATNGGGRLDKFIDAEPKVRELVDELFPNSFVVGSANGEVINNQAVTPKSDHENSNETRTETDLHTELMKLDDLRSKGLLTDAEFESEKKKLLESN